MSDQIFQTSRPQYDSRAKQTAGIIIECAGKILMMRRSPMKKYQPDKWCLVGGTVEPGETHLEAAIRECREESGILLTGSDLAFLGIVEYTEFNAPAQFHLFHARLSKKPRVVLNAESSQFVWCSIEQAKKLDLIQGEDESLLLYAHKRVQASKKKANK